KMKLDLWLGGQSSGGLFKQAQSAFEVSFLVKNPAQSVGRGGIGLKQLPRSICQLVSLVELFQVFGVEIGEIVQGRAELRIDGKKLFVSVTRRGERVQFVLNNANLHHRSYVVGFGDERVQAVQSLL